MNRRIVTIAAITVFGTAALGLEMMAVHGAARGAGELLASPEALAVGRAGRIAMESLGHQVTDRARAVAFDATMGVMRGLGAVYGATQSRTVVAAIAAPAPAVPAAAPVVAEAAPVVAKAVRIVRVHPAPVVQVDVETCCKAQKARKAERATS